MEASELIAEAHHLRLESARLRADSKRLRHESAEARADLLESVSATVLLSGKLFHSAAVKAVPKIELTPRQTLVLRLIAEGRSTKDIAYELGVTFKTAVSHRTLLMDRTGIHNVSGLTRLAIRMGLLAA
jgi:DNA-binding NarL/FixJ family response regulator